MKLSRTPTGRRRAATRSIEGSTLGFDWRETGLTISLGLLHDFDDNRSTYAYSLKLSKDELGKLLESMLGAVTGPEDSPVLRRAIVLRTTKSAPVALDGKKD